jgi:hypothetical protein
MDWERKHYDVRQYENVEKYRPNIIFETLPIKFVIIQRNFTRERVNKNTPGMVLVGLVSHNNRRINTDAINRKLMARNSGRQTQ